MNETKKNKGAVIALIIGLLLLISTGVYLAVKLLNKDEADDETKRLEGQDKNASLPTQTSGLSEVEKIKRMQRFLLNLGIKNDNNTIIDAINLTGGIDGMIGEGFNTALNEAIEKGYVKSFNDLQNLS